jgi:hypothetical protein
MLGPYTLPLLSRQGLEEGMKNGEGLQKSYNRFHTDQRKASREFNFAQHIGTHSDNRLSTMEWHAVYPNRRNVAKQRIEAGNCNDISFCLSFNVQLVER